MIGATDQETVSANVKRARNVSSSSGEDEEGEEEEKEEEDGEKRRNLEGVEEEDDGNVDEDNGVTAFREKVPEWMSMIDSGIKLSGPVTDL